MSKNKFGSFNAGDVVIFASKEVSILYKQKGNKTKAANLQSGMITGLKSKPCLYKLSNGFLVRGDKLKRIR